MNKRNIGLSELNIAPWMLGGNVFGWTIGAEQSFHVLDAFTSAGFNSIDTADAYSTWVPGNQGGESETIIGQWFQKRKNRSGIILATKVGSTMPRSPKKILKKAYILKAVEDSLRRLQTDYIDLYQSHYDDPETPVEETLEAYWTLIKSGKVRYIGASNFSPGRLVESINTSKTLHLPGYVSLQPQYNLYDRADYEANYAKICQEQQLGVIPYYSLASGFLSGKYRDKADLDKSKRGSGIDKYLDNRGFSILQAMDEVAERHHCSLAAIALAWLMARPGITAPIASATKVEQVKQLAKAATIKLSGAELELLNNASAY
ncbi:alcohol dehydrogenase [Chitinophaga caeni]|uniref:Alcohol dehydrogenase n=1 Tax=Chitinophaga caeni TaxID=2029983 RepID=A0A291QZS6_9BACT|nr:aldo/keto reductase [Chitinophaga caeni]ATL49344.1 alcohol dehydrogenase [Chitinophaga caeni]